MKLWDTSTQHCVQTIVAHRSEVSSLDIDPEKNFIFTGSSEGEVKAWKIDHESLSQGLVENEAGEASNDFVIINSEFHFVYRSQR